MKVLPKKNLLNLTQGDYERKIYRIVPSGSFFRMLTDRKIFFTRPDLWPDKHENLFLSQRIKSGGQLVEIGFKDQFYGQCWSLCKESDALWRLYGEDGSGVKISTSIFRLMESLKRRHFFSYVGKVKYLSKAKLGKAVRQFIDDGEMNFFGESQAIGPARTLLIKRVAYRHEKEIRALVFDADNRNRGADAIETELDPFDLIEQVTFGPRLEKSKYEEHKAKLRNLGFSGPVVRSALYDVPVF